MAHNIGHHQFVTEINNSAQKFSSSSFNSYRDYDLVILQFTVSQMGDYTLLMVALVEVVQDVERSRRQEDADGVAE